MKLWWLNISANSTISGPTVSASLVPTLTQNSSNGIHSPKVSFWVAAWQDANVYASTGQIEYLSGNNSNDLWAQYSPIYQYMKAHLY